MSASGALDAVLRVPSTADRALRRKQRFRSHLQRWPASLYAASLDNDVCTPILCFLALERVPSSSTPRHCRSLGNDNAQLFFHISEVLHPACSTNRACDLRSILKAGDEVQFAVEPSRHEEGKLHAKRVRKLAAGSLNSEHEDPIVRRGTVRCDNNGDLYVAPSEEDAQVPDCPQPVKKLKFSRHRHVKHGSKAPQLDDVVEFNVVIDKIRGSKRATNIEVIAEAPNEESMQGRHVVRTAPPQACAATCSGGHAALPSGCVSRTRAALCAGPRNQAVRGRRRGAAAGEHGERGVQQRRVRDGQHLCAAHVHVRGQLWRRAHARRPALRHRRQATAARCVRRVVSSAGDQASVASSSVHRAPHRVAVQARSRRRRRWASCRASWSACRRRCRRWRQTA